MAKPLKDQLKEQKRGKYSEVEVVPGQDSFPILADRSPQVVDVELYDVQQDDFEQVPRTDRGNDGYGDRGQLGTYQTTEGDFPDPDGLMRFTGYGATEEDLRRGYCKPSEEHPPNYDLGNYKNRLALPKLATRQDREDFEFRTRSSRSKGFLDRPRLPTER